jgi:hypothetical protein
MWSIATPRKLPLFMPTKTGSEMCRAIRRIRHKQTGRSEAIPSKRVEEAQHDVTVQKQISLVSA